MYLQTPKKGSSVLSDLRQLDNFTSQTHGFAGSGRLVKSRQTEWQRREAKKQHEQTHELDTS